MLDGYDGFKNIYLATGYAMANFLKCTGLKK